MDQQNYPENSEILNMTAMPKRDLQIPMHTPAKCRTESPSWYGERFPVPEEKSSWQVEFKEYAPHLAWSAKLAEKAAQGFAHAEDISLVPRSQITSFLQLTFDESGEPQCPLGRTGIKEGELYHKGANYTADILIRRFNPTINNWEMLSILRDDCHQRAIIGGFHDQNETIIDTACRETKEEVSLNIDPARLKMIYQGPVDDRRTSDNRWIETTLFDYSVSYEESLTLQPKAGDDAESVDWIPMTDDNMATMYASHGLFARMVLASAI